MKKKKNILLGIREIQYLLLPLIILSIGFTEPISIPEIERTTTDKETWCGRITSQDKIYTLNIPNEYLLNRRNIYQFKGQYFPQKLFAPKPRNPKFVNLISYLLSTEAVTYQTYTERYCSRDIKTTPLDFFWPSLVGREAKADDTQSLIKVTLDFSHHIPSTNSIVTGTIDYAYFLNYLLDRKRVDNKQPLLSVDELKNISHYDRDLGLYYYDGIYQAGRIGTVYFKTDDENIVNSIIACTYLSNESYEERSLFGTSCTQYQKYLDLNTHGEIAITYSMRFLNQRHLIVQDTFKLLNRFINEGVIKAKEKEIKLYDKCRFRGVGCYLKPRDSEYIAVAEEKLKNELKEFPLTDEAKHRQLFTAVVNDEAILTRLWREMPSPEKNIHAYLPAKAKSGGRYVVIKYGSISCRGDRKYCDSKQYSQEVYVSHDLDKAIMTWPTIEN